MLIVLTLYSELIIKYTYIIKLYSEFCDSNNRTKVCLPSFILEK